MNVNTKSYLQSWLSSSELGWCRATGDPHYNTFDEERIHFQGVCNYTLAQTQGNEMLEDFKAIVRITALYDFLQTLCRFL